jgi:FkbM family methyltransferase
MKFAKRLLQRALHSAGYDVTRCWDSLVMLRHQTDYLSRDRAFNKFLLEQHLAFVLKRLDVNAVLDVGANTGQYALGLRRWGYDGHIISFEPVRAVYEAVHVLAREDPKWTVHPFALGRQASTAPIHITHNSLFSSFLTPNAYVQERFGHSGQLQRVEEVPVQRLDVILDQVTAHVTQPRLFLKMDTQGCDLEVWAGLGTRREALVGLQSEVSVMPLYERMPAMCEAIAAYESAGFSLSGLFPVCRDQTLGRVIEFDCVLVRTP